MHSREGETVPFVTPVDPNAGSRKGNVELWMTDVEAAMRAAVRDQVARARRAYATEPRTSFVLEWPGQVVLTVDQLYWTMDTEEALSAADPADALQGHSNKLTRELNDIVTLVRGDLSVLQRATLSALTTINVHARDGTRSMGWQRRSCCM